MLHDLNNAIRAVRLKLAVSGNGLVNYRQVRACTSVRSTLLHTQSLGNSLQQQHTTGGRVRRSIQLSAVTAMSQQWRVRDATLWTVLQALDQSHTLPAASTPFCYPDYLANPPVVSASPAVPEQRR